MNVFQSSLVSLVTATIAVVLVAGLSFAHSGATGMVKDRMNMMKDMGEAMKEMAAMLRGKTVYDAERVKKLATDMQAHSEHIPKMFPKGSNTKPSEAKGTIWTEPEGFVKSAKALGDYAGTLAGYSGDQAAAKAAFGDIGKTCKSCHTDYRVKKN